MAQISLYMDDSMSDRLNEAAKTRNCSVSKYVAEIVEENLTKYEAEETYKKQVLSQLCGALDDNTFSIPQEISTANDVTRRYDLL
jgi:metal-responsive CopG/Arc/MetJ family transcriptional regulator